MTKDPRQNSRAITHGYSRAPARAMLKGIGFTSADLEKPIIGVANTWIETMPCNFHLRRLAEDVKAGIRAAGGTPMEFNTIAVSDGVTMGTQGMKASLVSREVIADSIELVSRGHLFDGIVDIQAASPWCKPMPEAFGIAMQAAGESDPSRCVMIDDLPRTVEAARRLGLFGVLYGADGAGADARFQDWRDLPALLAEK